MKKRTLFGILCVLLLVGCGDSMFPDLPDDAIAFVGKEYLDKGRGFIVQAWGNYHFNNDRSENVVWGRARSTVTYKL